MTSVSDIPDEIDDVNMEFNWAERRPPKWFLRAVITVLVSVGLFQLAESMLVAVRDLLVMVLVAFFVSFAVEPAADWFESKGLRRGAATGLVFVGLLITLGLFVWLMSGLVIDQVRTLVDDLPGKIETATDWANRRFDANITTDQIIDQVRSYQGDVAKAAGDVGGRVVSVTGSVLSVVFQTFTVGLFAFYLTADGPKLRRSVCSVLPPRRQRVVLTLWELAIHKTGSYLYSRALLAALASVAASIAFAIIGVPSPVPLALWLGVISQFIPVVGTYIGGLVPLVIALIDRPVSALWVLAFVIGYQQIENYFFAPRITAETMEIHPAVGFGAVIAGGSILGPIGTLLALPAAAIIQAFASTYLERHDIEELEAFEARRPGGAHRKSADAVERVETELDDT